MAGAGKRGIWVGWGVAEGVGERVGSAWDGREVCARRVGLGDKGVVWQAVRPKSPTNKKKKISQFRFMVHLTTGGKWKPIPISSIVKRIWYPEYL